jgi:hypothetical protein
MVSQLFPGTSFKTIHTRLSITNVATLTTELEKDDKKESKNQT